MTYYWERNWNKIPIAVKCAFFSAFLVGLYSHIIGITNLLVNHDSIYLLYNEPSNRVIQGRWFLSEVRDFLMLDVSSGTASFIWGIFFIALSSALLVSRLKIKSNLVSIIIGVMMVVFPTVVSTNTYGVLSAAYFGALFLCSLSIWFADKGNVGCIVSIVILTLSMGIYAAYIDFVAGVFLLKLLLELFEKKQNVKQWICQGLKYLFILFASIACYYIVLQIMIKITGMSLTSSRGMDQLNNVQFENIPILIISAYKKVFNFFWFDQYGENTVFSAGLYRGIILSGLCCYIVLIVKSKIYKEKLKLVFSALILMLYPLAIHAIAVLGQNANTHWCMIYSFILLPIMVIVLAERIEQINIESVAEEDKEVKKFAKGSTLLVGLVGIVCVLQSYLWFVVTQECYMYYQMGNTNALSLAIQLCVDLTDQGYDETMPLAVVGDGESTHFTSKMGFSKTQYTGVRGADFIMHARKLLPVYLRDMVGYNITICSDEDITALSQSNEVIKMPIYPENGSIKEINGTMVVKVSPVKVDLVKDVEGKIGENTQIIFDDSVLLEASKEEAFKYLRVAEFKEPNKVYRLSCEDIRCIAGDADSIDVVMYQEKSKQVIAKRNYPVGEKIEWVFETSEYVSEDPEYSVLLLVYAGEQRKTNGNTIEYKNLMLEHLVDGATYQLIEGKESHILLENNIILESSEEEAFTMQKIAEFEKPNEIYRLTCKEVNCTVGDAKCISAVIYQPDTKKVIEERVFPIGQPIDWVFDTTKYVSEDSDQTYQLLLYAGERRKTNGNTVEFNNLILEQFVENKVLDSGYPHN